MKSFKINFDDSAAEALEYVAEKYRTTPANLVIEAVNEYCADWFHEYAEKKRAEGVKDVHL